MRTLTRNSDLMGDRYRYDMGNCSYANGWAQIDTYQDAPYFGVWTNPERREIFTYCEGDLTLEKCDSADEYTQAIRDAISFYDSPRTPCRIDPGVNHDGPMALAFKALGLGDMLH